MPVVRADVDSALAHISLIGTFIALLPDPGFYGRGDKQIRWSHLMLINLYLFNLKKNHVDKREVPFRLIFCYYYQNTPSGKSICFF